MTNLLHAKFKRAMRSTLCWMILFVLASAIFLILSLLTYFDLLVIPKETSKNICGCRNSLNRCKSAVILLVI